MRCLACLGVGLLSAFAYCQPKYDFVDLTALFGTGLSVRDINNNGVIVANKAIVEPDRQACIIENGKLTFLPMYLGKHRWVATAINDNGDVLGSSIIGGTRHTVLYRKGTVIDLGLPGSKESAAGIGLDNLGRVVGTTQVGVSEAFVWENGVTTFLPGLSEWGSGAVAISDSGVITGTSNPTVGGPSHAVRWVNGIVEDIHPMWANHHGAGVAVNNVGDIAGWAWQIPGGQQGVVWRGGNTFQMPNFGGGTSRAYDINSQTQVVGWGSTLGGSLEAFYWDDGSMYTLTDLMPFGHGYDLAWGQNINDSGQILALSSLGTTDHWLVLNPVPEPAPIAVLTVALVALTISRRLRSSRE